MAEKFEDAPFGEYMTKMKRAIDAIPEARVEEAVALVEKTRQQGGTVYALGNGGSAAIASHLVNEFWKGCTLPGEKRLKAICLCDNIASFSAYANDEGYENVFSGELEGLVAAKDIVFAISSSGNSKNILNAAETAQKAGAKVIGLTGFSGGKLKEAADVSIHVADEHYGRVEDAHMIVVHYIGSALRRLMAGRK